MDSLKLLERRHSVREYKHKKFNEQDKKYLNVLFLEKPIIKNDQSIEFIFIDHGFDVAEKLQGIAGYFGNMIEAPHYYAVLCQRHPVCYKIAGYQGEWFILKAIQEDLGTCWIEVHDSKAVKEVLNINSDKEVAALIAIGYPKKESQQSKIFSSKNQSSLSSLTDLGYPDINLSEQRIPDSNRKSITEFVYMNTWGQETTLEELEQLGLHEAIFYMRLAPSYANRQPWIFLIKEKEIDLLIEIDSKIPLASQGIDAGIAMLYFEIGMHASGIKGNWNFEDVSIPYEIPENYKFAGRYHF